MSYVESPLDRIVNVHFGTTPPPPDLYSGTCSFSTPGHDYLFIGAYTEQGPEDATGFSNFTSTGNAFTAGGFGLFPIGVHGNTGQIAHIETDIYAEIDTIYGASPVLNVWLQIRDFATNALYWEAGPAMLTTVGSVVSHFSGGVVPVVPPSVGIKVAWRAQGNNVSGFGRTDPGFVTMTMPPLPS